MKYQGLFFGVFSILFLSGCGTDSIIPTSKEEKNDKSKVCVTGGYKDVTEISATLSGFANLTSDMTGDIKLGVVCSTNPTPDLNNGIMRTTRELNADNLFSVTVTGLLSGAKHYYRAFVYRNNVYTYGETKSFETLEINASVTTDEVSGITENAATISGSISFSSKANLSVKKGFYVSATNSTKPDKWYSATSGFSIQLTNLEYGKTYYYMAAAKIEDITFTGSVKSFTTSYVPVERVSLDKTEHTFHTIGGTLTLKATVHPADASDKSVDWSSDKEDVVTVDSNGGVSAKGNGKATITVTTRDQGKTATCEVTVAQWVTDISLDKTSLTLTVGDEATLTVTSILPKNAIDKSYTWSSSDNAIVAVDNSGNVTAKTKGTATITATANDGSEVFAPCSVNVKNPCPPGAVNLGLSIFWATSNLSTSGLCANPEDYGDYYAWGEIEPKEDYSWATYKWCDGSNKTLTKYCTNSSYGKVDSITELQRGDKSGETMDDAAGAKLGGKWRIPTDSEWTELRENCTWEWTDNYYGTGVAGSIFTSNVEGYKDKSIFLPAAGYRSKTNLRSAGSGGYYWSSSLGTDYPDRACDVDFDSRNLYRHNYSRYPGQSVRPVYAE